MKKWAVKDQSEFEARQSCFDFGMACRFVSSLAADVKHALSAYVQRLFKKTKEAKNHFQLELFQLDAVSNYRHLM